MRADAPSAKWSVQSRDGALVVADAQGREVLRYVLQKPADSKLSVESACYFHPLTTPSGIAVTDVAPDDHKHHRGVFLAWVEMHGKKDADFWGWGEHAPKDGRKIVNREVADLSASADAAGFRARNDWVADDVAIMTEDLSASIRREGAAQILDLTYTLTPAADLTLSRWAFSGFCVRARRDAKLEAIGPEGPVKLPDPSHVKPETDWPAAAWYAYALSLADGKLAGIAVIDHPKNPKSLWHNNRGVRMLNPCIVAPAEVKLKAGEPLVLKYRVVAHDGRTPNDMLTKLSRDW